MNYLDGFSGYGGFHRAFELAGWTFDNIYFSEIDKHAIANYRYNFPNSIYAGSIDTICESGIITELDFFTFGWPCQDNSIAGKRAGQSAGTRSGLLYKAVDIINKFKPRNFVAENVAGLLSVNKGIDIIESFKILSYLNESMPQYDIEMQLLNTLEFLPHNRERLFFVGHLRGSGSRQVFPFGESEGSDNKRLQTSELTLLRWQNLKEGIVESEFAPTLRKSGGMDGIRKTPVIKIRSATKRGYELARSGDSVNLSMPESKTRRGRVGNNMVQTLDTSCNIAILYKDEFRRVTPIECERLQGLPDNWTRFGNYGGAIKEISEPQRYHLVGNGVSIPPVQAIAERLLKNN